MANPNLVRKNTNEPTGGAGEVSPAGVVDSALKGKNLFINSNFSFWQRGTSFATSGTQSFYTADRMKLSSSSSVARTVSRSTLVPPGSQSQYSYQYLVNTGSALSAAQWEEFVYIVEGNDLARFRGQQFTLSFWVRANFSGTMTIGFRNTANNRSYVVPYTIAAANTWEYKTMTVTHDPTGTWSYDATGGMSIYFPMGTGSNYQTGTPNQWINSNFGGVPGMVAVSATTGNQVNIADVVLNVGPNAASHSLYGDTYNGELAACQRYYEKSYDLNVNPGAIVGEGCETWVIQAGQAGERNIVFRVTKRAIPTFRTYSTTTGNIDVARDNWAGVDRTATLLTAGLGNASIAVSSPGTARYTCNWIADADF